MVGTGEGGVRQAAAAVPARRRYCWRRRCRHPSNQMVSISSYRPPTWELGLGKLLAYGRLQVAPLSLEVLMYVLPAPVRSSAGYLDSCAGQ